MIYKEKICRLVRLLSGFARRLDSLATHHKPCLNRTSAAEIAEIVTASFGADDALDTNVFAVQIRRYKIRKESETSRPEVQLALFIDCE